MERKTIKMKPNHSEQDKVAKTNSSHMSLGMTMNWNDTNPPQQDPCADLKWTRGFSGTFNGKSIVEVKDFVNDHNAAIDEAVRRTREEWQDRLIKYEQVRQKFGAPRIGESDQWISVKDRLPTEGDFKPTERIELFWTHLNYSVVVKHEDFVRNGTFTHWRRITPPKP